MSTATKGRRAEWYIRDRYLAAGCQVTRAAGSKGIADLIAHSPEAAAVYFISVKVNSWPGKAEMETLHVLKRRCRSQSWYILVYRRDDHAGWRMRFVHERTYLQGEAWWPAPRNLRAETS